MRRAHPLSLVSLICLASVAPAAAQPPTIEQPKEAGMFRVNPITGAPMPLESLSSKVEYAGRTYYCYLPGPASTVAFPYGEPQVFAARFFGTTLEELR